MIPKIIHYCWFGHNTMSQLELECLASWEKYCPEFELKCWDESNFPVDFCEFTKEAYRLGKYAFVADVARVYALFTDGGIYLDTDMLLLAPLEKLLLDEFFIGEHLPNQLAVGIMGSMANHSFLDLVLKFYREAMFDPHSLLLIPNLFDKLNEEYVDAKIKIYSPEVFYPLPFKQKEEEYLLFVTPNTLAVHLWNHTWKDEFSYLKSHQFLKSYSLLAKHLFFFPKTYLNISYLSRFFRENRLMIKQFLYYKINGRAS
jgi:mannosyltransferase OCH1-like enzyme